MLKLLLTLVSLTLVLAILLQLRQQKLELNAQINKLHNQIEDTQARLWNQQLQIAMYTAPNAIAETVHSKDLKMVPTSPLPAGSSDWTQQDDPAPGEVGN